MFAATTITVSGSDSGRTYEGVGAVFSNGMTRLLMDYPANQREDILDFLFKAKFGASLQHVKVEIGADVNTSAGTEPSHMRSSGVVDITRGSNLWLAKQAHDINTSIKLDALAWGLPAWVTDNTKKYTYFREFLEGARDEPSLLLDFDFLGATLNETEGDVASPTASGTQPFQRDWIVNTLRPGLDSDGFSAVGLTAADSNLGWWIADKVQSDSALKSALYSLNAHYVDHSASNDGSDKAIQSGLRLWAGEHLGPGRHGFHVGTLDMAMHIMRSYTLGRMTKYEMHPALEAAYPNTPFNYKSLLVAQWPWTGHYEITPGLWGVAHFTQFSWPGWKYLDNASAGDGSGGYVALHDPNNGNWSIVFVNYSAQARDYTVNITGGLSTGTVHVWRSDESAQFIQDSNITPVSGSLAVSVPAYSLCSITTTTGQAKGTPTYSNPAGTTFALDYSDNFESSTIGRQPKYFSDQGGAFEIASDGGGKVLRQVISSAMAPSKWKYRSNPEPYTIMGDADWKNYEVEVKVKLVDASGWVIVGGRATQNGKLDNLADCYNLKLTKPSSGSSTWQLRNKETVIGSASGTTTFNAGTWYTVKIRFLNNTITAWLNGTQLGTVNAGYLSSGQMLLGSSYNDVRFDDLVVRKIDGSTPVDCLRFNDKDARIVWTGTWENQDGSWENYDRSLTASRESGSRMYAKFNGTTVTVLGNRMTDAGKADIYIDGALETTIDAYAATAPDPNGKAGEYLPLVHQALVTVRGLSAGDHTVEVVVRSDKNAGATDNYIRIDGIETLGGTGLVNPPLQQFLAIDDDFDASTAGTTPSGWWVDAAASTSAQTANFPSTGNRSLKLDDSTTGGAVAAWRKFTPTEGIVSLRFGYHAPQVGRWNRMYVQSLATNAVKLFDTDDVALGLCYENSSGAKVKIRDISNNVWYTFDIDINTVNDTFDLYINGVLELSGVALRNPVDTVDRIRFESGSGFTGTAYFDTVEVTANGWQPLTAVEDYFNGQTAGERPRGWNVSVYEATETYPGPSENSNVMCTVESVPSVGDKSLRLHDYHSAKGVSASRNFPRTSDHRVTLEWQFMTTATGSKSSMAVRGRYDPVVKLVDSATNGLAYINAAGSEVALMSISASTWYAVRVEVNAANRVYDLYVNGVLKLSDQPYVSGGVVSVDSFVVATDPAASGFDFYLDPMKISVP